MDLDSVKFQVDAQYNYRHYYGIERPVDAKPNELNCVGFALRYAQVARENGFKDVSLVQCPGHMYAKVGEYVLDNKRNRVVKQEDYSCESR